MRTLMLPTVVTVLSLSGCGDGPSRQALADQSVDAVAAGVDEIPGPPTRRVWARAGDYATASPDGMLMAFVDWSTGDVAVHDLSTDVDRRVTNTGGWVANGSWAEEPFFSPDGQEIVYAYGNVQLSEVQEGDEPFLYQLRIVSLDGSEDRSIWQAKSFREVAYPMDWSDRHGIVLRYWTEEIPDGGLAVISPDDGTLRILKHFEPGLPCPCVEEASFSPDGSLIAYRQATALRLWNMETETDRDLGIEVRTILGWVPDGTGFLVQATREGTSGFWLVPMTDDGVAAPPRLVRGGIPFAHRAGRSGESFFYYIPAETPQLFQTSVDLEAGRVLSTPTALTPVQYGMTVDPVWSPDGRQLAYALVDVDRNWTLFLRSADGDEVTALADLGKVRQVLDLSWARDGSALYYVTVVQDRTYLQRTDSRTGVTEEILANPPDDGPKPVIVTPDERRVLLVRAFPQSPEELPTGLILRDLESGAERVLSDEVPRALGLSPDGTTVATLVTDTEGGLKRRLTLVPLDGGAPTLLVEHDVEEGAIQPPSGLSWTRDGRFILAAYWTAASGDAEQRYDMVAYPVDGGEWIHLGQVTGGRAYPDLHPDGHRLVYVDGELRSEVWVMEGWK